jgi:hypothetical protein
VLFGAKQLGEIAEEVVTLQSLTAQRLEVIGVVVHGEGLVVEGIPESQAVGPSFVLKQQILKAGQQTCRVVFRVRRTPNMEGEAEVPVSYLGLNTVAR